MFGFSTSEFKYNIGDTVHINNNNFSLTACKKETIDRGYRKEYRKYYKYTCNKCGWIEGWIEENNLKRGVGCACCANKTAVLGINTIWDTDRWMCGLGVSEEDAKKYTKGSDKKIEIVCPNCNNMKVIKIGTIHTYKSIGCACGDGFSYPEKFMNNILTQLGVNFEMQYSPEWINSKRYDFYLPEYNMIIETHGVQHYEDCNWSKYEDIQANDKYKRELALENGIDTYIELDCKRSDLGWIKNSILNSKLNDMFDLSNIDWNKCEEFALGNLIKEVCDYWNNKEEWETTYTIAENNHFGIARSHTIVNYLKRGNDLGWCVYNPKEESRKGSIKAGKKNVKWDVCVYKEDYLIYVFEGYSDLEHRSLDILGEKITVTMGRWAVKKGALCRGYRIEAIRRATTVKENL